MTLKLRLPFTHRPANDARDLGVLVAALRVGPAERAAPPGAPQQGPVARVAATPEAGGGWRVAPSLNGEVTGDPGHSCVLAFRFAGGEVAALRGLRLFVNAVPVLLEIGAEGGGWLATATLPAALLRQRAPAGWDLVADPQAGEVPLLRDVTVAPMAGTALAEAVIDAPAADPVPADMPPPPQDPVRDALLHDGPLVRWDLCAGIGPQEGPFEDLGIPPGVRWIVARRCTLVLEAPERTAGQLRLRYRSLLPRQDLRAVLNGGAATALAAVGRGLREPHELVLDVALAAGRNELALEFSGAVREPGSGRELVLLIEAAAFIR